MNSVITIMLLISCTDSFSACNAANDMVKIYPTQQACETALLPAVGRVIEKSEIVFGKCIKADQDFVTGDLSMYWHVDQHGNFIVELSNEDSNEDGLSVPLDKIEKPITGKNIINKPLA